MPKRFNLEFNKKNPFLLKKKLNNRTWDIIYENCGYDVKKSTFKDYYKLLEITTENRDLINWVFLVCVADIPNMTKKLDSNLVLFIQSLFNRLLKTSKVIQDLIIQGSYIEANSLLRSNFERGVQLEYFLGEPEKLKDYLKARSNGNKKKLARYSLFNLVKHIKKDYNDYKYLCQFVHPYFHKEDVIDIEGKTFVWTKAYNEYNYREFMWTICFSNNILLEVFLKIFEFMKAFVPQKELEDENLKHVFDNTKKLLFISLTAQENREPKNWTSGNITNS